MVIWPPRSFGGLWNHHNLKLNLSYPLSTEVYRAIALLFLHKTKCIMFLFCKSVSNPEHSKWLSTSNICGWSNKIHRAHFPHDWRLDKRQTPWHDIHVQQRKRHLDTDANEARTKRGVSLCNMGGCVHIPHMFEWSIVAKKHWFIIVLSLSNLKI